MAQSGVPGGSGFVPVVDIAPYLAAAPEGKRRVARQIDRDINRRKRVGPDRACVAK